MEGALAAAVICAAGSSSRMGGIKKEYQKINGGSVTVLGSAARAFASVSSVGIIVIAIPENTEDSARDALPLDLLKADKPKILFVCGGDTRRASVYNALLLLAPYNPRYVLIHDGARPWVSASLIEKIIEEVKKYGAVIPAVPFTDTPKECYLPLKTADNTPIGDIKTSPISRDAPFEFAADGGGGTVFIKKHLKRANLCAAQTPQAFKFPEILSAHERAAAVSNEEEFTDDAEVWGRFYGQVAVIPGSPENKKITFPEDID